MFGKEFKVLKEVKLIFKIVGDDYPECFCAYGEENGKLEYCIIDDNFCQPSPANYCDANYVKKLRDRGSKILEDLVKSGHIEEYKEGI